MISINGSDNRQLLRAPNIRRDELINKLFSIQPISMLCSSSISKAVSDRAVVVSVMLFVSLSPPRYAMVVPLNANACISACMLACNDQRLDFL